MIFSDEDAAKVSALFARFTLNGWMDLDELERASRAVQEDLRPRYSREEYYAGLDEIVAIKPWLTNK